VQGRSVLGTRGLFRLLKRSIMIDWPRKFLVPRTGARRADAESVRPGTAQRQGLDPTPTPHRAETVHRVVRSARAGWTDA